MKRLKTGEIVLSNQVSKYFCSVITLSNRIYSKYIYSKNKTGTSQVGASSLRLQSAKFLKYAQFFKGKSHRYKTAENSQWEPFVLGKRFSSTKNIKKVILGIF